MSYEVGKTTVKKHCYAVYLRVHGIGALDPWTSDFASLTASELKPNDGSSSCDWANGTFSTGDFGKIGAVEEKPTISGSEDEEIGLASCDSHTIAELIEGMLNQLEVTKGNYDALRDLMKNGEVDVLFYDSNNANESVGARKVNLKVFPSIIGNDLNKIAISFKKSAGDLDDYFSFVTIS